MNPQEREPLFLHDIVSAIDELESFTADRAFEDYMSDALLRRAAERCIEVVSEASRRIPESWKNEYPDIPWKKVAGIGNVLRHNYDVVDPKALWLIATREIQPVKRAAQELLERHTTLR